MLPLHTLTVAAEVGGAHGDGVTGGSIQEAGRVSPVSTRKPTKLAIPFGARDARRCYAQDCFRRQPFFERGRQEGRGI